MTEGMAEETPAVAEAAAPAEAVTTASISTAPESPRPAETETAMQDDAAPSTSASTSASADPTEKVAIHVGDLPSDITEEDLRALFAARGELARCEVKSRKGRFCFVEYTDDAVAEAVLADFIGSFTTPPTLTPPFSDGCLTPCTCTLPQRTRPRSAARA